MSLLRKLKAKLSIGDAREVQAPRAQAPGALMEVSPDEFDAIITALGSTYECDLWDVPGDDGPPRT